MKVLMVSNSIPASAAQIIKRSGNASGGWVEAMAQQLILVPGIEVYIAFKNDSFDSVYEEVNGIICLSINYSYKGKKCDINKQADDIIEKVVPDIIHIEGTEFPHALAMVQSGERHNVRTIVSWQTVLNGVLEYEAGQLPIADMMLSFNPVDTYIAWLIYLRKHVLCKRRMKLEQQIIESTPNILGRTTWDRAYSYKLNPKAKYYSCRRTLKPIFYQTQWSIEKVKRHSIYFGSAYTITKGFHFMLYAMPLLIRDYPDLILYVTGDNPYDENDHRPFYRKSYSLLIKRIIKKLKIKDHIVFTGPVSGDVVADIMTKSHVYVMSSVIENSPNSFAEAMAIGMPCVISYQGGVPDMATDDVEALFFRNDDPALLAWKIKQVFDNDDLALSLSKNAQIRARNNHNPEGNTERLVSVYKQMLEDE